MTRWNDISDEDKRDFAWVEVTDRGDEWPTYIKGSRRQPGRNTRRWEYRQFVVAHGDLRSDETEKRLNYWGADGWELLAVHPHPYQGTTTIDMLYVLKRKVPE
jgi:hypothetical protein